MIHFFHFFTIILQLFHLLFYLAQSRSSCSWKLDSAWHCQITLVTLCNSHLTGQLSFSHIQLIVKSPWWQTCNFCYVDTRTKQICGLSDTLVNTSVGKLWWLLMIGSRTFSFTMKSLSDARCCDTRFYLSWEIPIRHFSVSCFDLEEICSTLTRSLTISVLKSNQHLQG